MSSIAPYVTEQHRRNMEAHMPRKQSKSKPPAYCLHKASGQAVVRIHGRDRYLGKYGSAEGHECYELALADWRSDPLPKPPTIGAVSAAPPHTSSVNELLLRFLAHAESYYIDASGKSTHELQDLKYALRPLRRLFGRTPVVNFGPLALKAVRQHMIDVE